MLAQQVSGSTLREEFVAMILTKGVGNLKEDLEQLHELMCEDYLEKGLTLSQAKEEVLKDLDESFLQRGVEIGPFLKEAFFPARSFQKDYKLWDSQKTIHDLILESYDNFLITGPAGSGKTRLLSVIAENMRVIRRNVTVTAKTSHLASQHYDGISFSNLLKASLTSCDVIFIENGNLVAQSLLVELDGKLQRECNSGKRFGGKQVIVFADFEQFLPYTEGWANQASASIERSNLLEGFTKLELAESLKFPVTEDSFVTEYKQLISETLGSLDHPQKFEDRVLLAPRNCDVDFLNDKILEKYPGPVEDVYSLSQATSTTGKRIVDKELYNADFRGLEKHHIVLKPNAIICLTRDQGDVPAGTRLIYLEETEHFLKCQMLSGLQKGHSIKVYRSQHSETFCGKSIRPGMFLTSFSIQRKQFPVKLAFAMTIHRSQGQYFRHVGLYNMNGAFGHGQLRVAFTRCKNATGLRIMRGCSEE